MTNERGGRRFPFGQLLFWGIVVMVLRVNLPPASVSGALDLSDLEKENWFARVVGGTTLKMMVADPVTGHSKCTTCGRFKMYHP